MNQPKKSQELSLVRDVLWTTALIILVFGLATAFAVGSDQLVAMGYMGRDSRDYLFFQLVANVAKAAEVAVILVIIVAHAVVTVARTVRYVVDSLREVFTRE